MELIENGLHYLCEVIQWLGCALEVKLAVITQQRGCGFDNNMNQLRCG